MLDEVVSKTLRSRGFDFSNQQELLCYESASYRSRVLDNAPPRIKLGKATDIEVYGCKAEFVMAYNLKMQEEIPEVCYIDNAVTNMKRQCDKQVYVVLVTLANQGVTRIPERTDACFQLFRDIITQVEDPVITVQSVYTLLSTYPKRSYYVGELMEAIRICLFGDNEAVLEWLRLVNPLGFYTEAISKGRNFIRDNCKKAKDVKPFLKMIYDTASKDLAFMKQIYKRGANRYLIPVIYALRNDYPEVMNAGTNTGGFM